MIYPVFTAQRYYAPFTRYARQLDEMDGSIVAPRK